MILLDTHIWIWWVQGDSRLSTFGLRMIREHEATGVGVSVLSGIQLLPLTPEIAVEATELPRPFNRDPADQLLVATLRRMSFQSCKQCFVPQL